MEAVWRKPGEKRKSATGRKPWDAVVMLKAIILCELYTLSDEQVEYQVRDRLSFMRFPGLGLEDPVPGQRNKREENATIKAGDTPEAWKEKPARLRRKDCDARWTGKTAKAITATRTTSTSTAVTSRCVTMT